MLDELTPAQIVEWRAAKETLPLDDGWRQAGTVAAEVNNTMARYVAGKAGKSRVDKRSLRSPDEYIPKIRGKKRGSVRVNQASIDVYHAMIRQQYVHNR